MLGEEAIAKPVQGMEREIQREGTGVPQSKHGEDQTRTRRDILARGRSSPWDHSQRCSSPLLIPWQKGSVMRSGRGRQERCNFDRSAQCSEIVQVCHGSGLNASIKALSSQWRRVGPFRRSHRNIFMLGSGHLPAVRLYASRPRRRASHCVRCGKAEEVRRSAATRPSRGKSIITSAALSSLPTK